MAIGWQIFSLRHQPLDLGLVGLTLFLPQLLLAVPAGLIADHLDRRLVCIATSLLEVTALLAFVALSASKTTSLAAYFTAIAFIGIAHAISAPAQRSLLATVVATEHFVRASAFTGSISQLSTIAGPALAGVLIAIRTPLAFAAAACCYAISAVGFFFLQPRPSANETVSLLQSARDGIHFIFDRKLILGAISLDLFAVLFGGSTALLPVFAQSILHVGPTGFGMLRSAPALGAAIVAVIIARRPIVHHAGPLLFWCIAGFGIFTIVFGLSKNFVLSLLALALCGGFDMVSVVIRIALVQLNTPDPMRGRVGAVENVFIGASNELGAFESGALAQLIGTQTSVVAGGCATLAVIALWALIFPALRRFDRLASTD